MERYTEVEKSVELAEYKKLFHVVKSADFKEKKKKRSKTGNTKIRKNTELLRKFDKLENSADIKLYYQVLNSTELKQYLKFESTPEFEQMGDAKKLKESEYLQKNEDLREIP